MQPRRENTPPFKNGRTIVSFLVGFFMGFGLCAAYMILSSRHQDTWSEKDVTVPRNDESPHPDKACLSSAPEKRTAQLHEREKLKRAIVAAQMAKESLEDESLASEQMDDATSSEMRLLREALPGNWMLPEKNTQERQEQAKWEQDAQDLMVLIQSGEATDRDRKHMYELTAKQYHDEIAAIDFCKDNLAEAESNNSPPLNFCREMSFSNIADRRKRNEDALASLKDAFENDFSNVRGAK